ncbi:MAG TPA: BamA/TamA family outer membrane protein [Chitinophagaceae bacterium]|jgi:hypothetical protein|nr:BamA/TamA family outer membrane protein [Chitinophagaceae bacterium]
MRKVLGLLLLLSLAAGAEAQRPNFIRRYINRLIDDTTSIAEPQFIAYPTVAFSPETSWELGLSSLYIYYARRDTTNRLSEINGFTFYTLNRQYGGFFDHALYSHGNRWSFLGRLKYQDFPLLYYGIGPATPKEYTATVEARQLSIKERVLKKVHKNIFAGVEADFQRLGSVRFVPHDSNNLELPPGAQGYTNFGLGAGVLYDNRHNVLNVRDGVFAELALLRYDPLWGSDFSFTSIISDNRFYRPVSSRNVLAAQVFGQFTMGTPPFNQLALLGGESLLRGYYAGRFRDRNQLAAQVEYRMLPLPFRFTKRWGAAVFGGTGTVFPRFSELSARDFVWAGGAGIRFLLFPKKDIFSRLDVAFTKEGSGVYIFIGEAF